MWASMNPGMTRQPEWSSTVASSGALRENVPRFADRLDPPVLDKNGPVVEIVASATAPPSRDRR